MFGLRLGFKKWLVLLMLASSVEAFGFSHDYIMFNRSSIDTDLWFSQSFGASASSLNLKINNQLSEPSTWKGTSSRTEFGLESMKFFQISAGIENLDLKRQDSKMHSISGMRAFSELKFVFSAPIFNVEVGGGMAAGNLDYLTNTTNSELFATSRFYSFGINHYLSSRISLFGRGHSSTESIRRTGGDNHLTAIDGVINTFMGGLRISL